MFTHDKLVSLLEMLQFYAPSFLRIVATLEDFADQFGTGQIRAITAEVKECLDSIQREAARLGWDRVIEQAELLRGDIGTETPEGLRKAAEILQNQIYAEMKTCLYFAVPYADRRLYEDPTAVWAEVADKFDVLTDAQEASRCLALDRPTACVFHLMRVVEVGVRVLGTRFGVAVAEEKNWQNILEQTSAAIKRLPDGSAAEKERKQELAGIASHLFNVKVKWRNPTMHPRASYSVAEAREVFESVKTFMAYLARTV